MLWDIFQFNAGHGQQRRLSPALVEGVYLDAVVCVLLQDLLRVFIRVEGVHEHQWYVCVVGLVQMLQNMF